jgi:3-oxoacyl-[acyl-carrier-protein] synthase II
VYQVAITGVGVVSALGSTVAEYSSALLEGRTAISQAPWANPAEGRYAWISSLPSWDPTPWIDSKIIDGTDLFTQYALAAAVQAVEDHGEPLHPSTGVVLGTTMAGVTSLTRAQRLLDTVGPEAVPRKLNIQAWPNMAAGQIAINWKLHGPLLTVSTACASSIDAIGTAAEMIHCGRADVIICGGTERGLCDVLYYSQLSYGMSKGVEDPALAMLPFDRRRTGLVEGEGAAVFVLERADRARGRGAHIYGYVRGFASLSDGYHPSSPDPSGEWEAQAMIRAQAQAGVPAADVDAIIAHATSTPKGDTAEIGAINDVFGERGESLRVTSIKGNVGHTGAASGAMGLIVGLSAISEGKLAHIAPTTEVEAGAKFEIVIRRPAEGSFDVIQVNAFGFGGQDTSMIVTGN